MYSPSQIKAILITPMLSGSVSAIASGTLITTILQSETKLSAPSKRILFGLCIHDCILSIASALSSLPVPKELGIWGAMGNVYSCDFQGFIFQIGAMGSVLYNCNLSIYYLCVIRFSMSDVTFSKKIEPFCHIIPNMYALTSAIYLLAKGYFNSIGNMCWVGPSPINCITNPDVECLRGDENAYNLRWIFLGYALYAAWGIVIITMISIVLVVVKQRRRSESWASGGRGRESIASSKSRRSSIMKNVSSGNVNTAKNKLKSLRKQHNKSQTADESNELTDSIRSLNNCKDPLVFNLKAMRAKTKRQSLIIKTPENESLVHKMYDDPHPFDVKTAKAAKRSSIRLSTQKLALADLIDNRSSLAGSDQQSLHSSFLRTSFDLQGAGSIPGISDLPMNARSKRRTLRSLRRRSSGESSQKRGTSLDDASKEVKVQALLYISSFVICWIFPIINRLLEEREKQTPFIIFEFARLFNPIQGLFNVLVYCRPFVRGLRMHHPEYSWWKAFVLTVKSGGDNNNAARQRNSSAKKPNKKVLDKIQQNHVEMMADIRQNRRSSLFNSSFRRSSVSMNMSMGASPSSSSLRKSCNGASFHVPEMNIKQTSRLDLNVDACEASKENDDQREKLIVEAEAPTPTNEDGSGPLNKNENNNTIVEKDLEAGITPDATS